MATDPLDRATGALVGLALGDALGMPTQLLTLDQILSRYGVVDRFHPGPDDHPVAAGLPAGHVTDDTDQAMIVARLLVQGAGRVDPYALVAELQAWEQRMIVAGSVDLLGPSTRRALDRIAAGEDIAHTGSDGTTNGAAMRIASVGVGLPPEPIGDLIALVIAVCQPTHGTQIAIAGACAIATAVSAGVDGADIPDAIRLAVGAAESASGRPPDSTGLTMIIRSAVDLAVEDRDDNVAFLRRIEDEIGTSLATDQSVPAALAIAARFPTSPWDAARHAATLGGDSDTIASMAAAVVGACCGGSAISLEHRAVLDAANPGLDLAQCAADLFRLRRSAVADHDDHGGQR